MPRLFVYLAVLVCVCACVNVCTAEDFQTKQQPEDENYLIPEAVKGSNSEDGNFEGKIYLENNPTHHEQEIIESRDTRSSINSILAQILNRLGKTSETFVGRNPTRASRQNGHRLYTPMWSKLKRNNDDFEKERSMNDEKFGTLKEKKSLSINGALSSLADMLTAEGHRRNQAAAHNLRQRLLVAGKRR